MNPTRHMLLPFALNTIMLLTAPAHAEVRCSGLPAFHLEHGYAFTEQGIVFAERFDDHSFTIWEHLPFADDDLRMLILSVDLVKLQDVRNSDEFAVFDGEKYLIYDASGSFPLEPVNEIRMPDRHVTFYGNASDVIAVVYDDVAYLTQDTHVDSVYVLDEDGMVADITSVIWNRSERISQCCYCDGNFYLRSSVGICVTDRGLETKFYFYSDECRLTAEDSLVAIDHRLFALHSSGSSVSELILADEMVEFEQTTSFSGMVIGLFLLSDRVVVEYYDPDYAYGASDPIKHKLADWETGDPIEGCNDAFSYFQIGDDLYGIRSYRLLIPYGNGWG